MFRYKKLKSLKFQPKVNNLPSKFVVNDRYEIYEDGVIYDTTKAKDIPQWIFELRNNLLN